MKCGKIFFEIVLLSLPCILCCACDSLNMSQKEKGKLSFCIEKVPSSYYNEGMLLKNISVKDTNDFILSVYSTDGSKVYHGKYGTRPADFYVLPGGYEVNLYSKEHSAPKFDAPVFGDSHTVVLNGSEQLYVKFNCSQINGGVRLSFNNDFKRRFPGSGVEIVQGDGRLAYSYTESRYAYIRPDFFTLVYKGAKGDTTLLHKRVEKGQMANMKLSYSIPDGYNSTFKIEVDTSRKWFSSDYNIGLRIPTGAVTIEEAKRMVGEKNVSVFGFIYGGDPTTVAIRIAPPFTSPSTLVIAPGMGERNRNNCFVVELPAGKIRDDLNLVGRPGHLGKAVVITGDIVPGYFNYIGVKRTKSYSFIK